MVMEDIGEVLDASITGVTMPATSGALLDLSKIDFQALAKRFEQSKTKNTDLEVLKAAIRAQLEKLIRLNKTRADYADKFEELIESYNQGSRNIEDLFNELLALSRALNDEQQRHVRENMSEEELTVFDLSDASRPRAFSRRARGSEEGRAPVAGAPENHVGARLAKAGPDEGASADRNRGRARPRFARRLHAAVVSAKMRGAVRACL